MLRLLINFKIKILFILLVTTLIIAISAVFVPYLFKDQIKSTVLEQVDNNLNANFYFDDLSVSLVKRFPLISLSFKNVLLVGKQHFKYDTLLSVKETSISFNLYSLVFNNELEMNSIDLELPRINAKILKNGLCNFDVLVQDSVNHTSHGAMKINIKYWKITQGDLKYLNEITNDLYQIQSLDATGQGDFESEYSDLTLKAFIKSISIKQNGVQFLSKKALGVNLKVDMDLKTQKFKINDLLIKINDFEFKTKGYIGLLKKGITTDLRFEVEKTDFKSFLSLVPGFHLEDLDQIETNGEFSFNGFVKGDIGADSLKIPTFQIDLAVDDGMFKFKTLPKAVDDINFHFHVQNNDGILENTVAHITNLNLNFNNNPIHGFVEIKGINNLYILADMKAKLDLSEISQFYPLKGIRLKGNLNTNLKINGRYNYAEKTFPLIDAFLQYENGNIIFDSVSVELDKIAGRAELINKTGQLSDTFIKLDSLMFRVDNEPFKISGIINDLTDYEYDLFIKGKLDLNKITKIYPSDDYNLKGLLLMDVETKGKISALMEKKWSVLNTTGKFNFTNVELNHKQIPKTLEINYAYFNLTPLDLQLTDLLGNIDNTSFNIKGEIYNYLPYLLGQQSVLEGTFTFESDTINLASFIKKDSASIQHPRDTFNTIYQIPNRIALTIKSKIKQLKYNNKFFDNINGQVKIKDAVLNVNKLSFATAGTIFKIDALYDTRDMKKVKFETSVDVSKLELNQALVTFLDVRTVDLDEATNGIFSTKYTLKGYLNYNYLPLAGSVQGGGKIIVDNAKIKGFKMFHHISKLTKRKELHEPEVDDIVFDTEIRNSIVYVKPLTFKIGRYNIDLEGSHTFENTMNYIFKIGVPPLNKLKIPIHISGPVDRPSVKLGKGHENFDFSQLNAE